MQVGAGRQGGQFSIHQRQPHPAPLAHSGRQLPRRRQAGAGDQPLCTGHGGQQRRQRRLWQGCVPQDQRLQLAEGQAALQRGCWQQAGRHMLQVQGAEAAAGRQQSLQRALQGAARTQGRQPLKLQCVLLARLIRGRQGAGHKTYAAHLRQGELVGGLNSTAASCAVRLQWKPAAAAVADAHAPAASHSRCLQPAGIMQCCRSPCGPHCPPLHQLTLHCQSYQACACRCSLYERRAGKDEGSGASSSPRSS